MILFKFKTREEFDKAVKLLKKAIDTMVSERFDHAVQTAEKTISVIKEKGAEIIEGLFKKNGIKDYQKEEDLSWAHPVSSIASVIRRLAFEAVKTLPWMGTPSKVYDSYKDEDNPPPGVSVTMYHSKFDPDGRSIVFHKDGKVLYHHRYTSHGQMSVKESEGRSLSDLNRELLKNNVQEKA
jgi:hypothetical protein